MNSCMHRGVKLCPADTGNSKRFMCGYHGWTYANTGELRGVPYDSVLYLGLDKKKFGLRAARAEMFRASFPVLRLGQCDASRETKERA